MLVVSTASTISS